MFLGSSLLRTLLILVVVKRKFANTMLRAFPGACQKEKTHVLIFLTIRSKILGMTLGL